MAMAVRGRAKKNRPGHRRGRRGGRPTPKRGAMPATMALATMALATTATATRKKRRSQPERPS